MATSKHFDVQTQGDITVVRFLEPKLFDHVLLTELQEQLLGFVEDSAPAILFVDFSTVEFCSTSLINTLLRVKKLMIGNQGHLRLVGMRPNVREAFQMLNLDGPVFEIHTAFADAQATLPK